MPDVQLIVEVGESISSVDVRNQIFLLKAGSNETRTVDSMLKIEISDRTLIKDDVLRFYQRFNAMLLYFWFVL